MNRGIAGLGRAGALSLCSFPDANGWLGKSSVNRQATVTALRSYTSIHKPGLLLMDGNGYFLPNVGPDTRAEEAMTESTTPVGESSHGTEPRGLSGTSASSIAQGRFGRMFRYLPP